MLLRRKDLMEVIEGREGVGDGGNVGEMMGL